MKLGLALIVVAGVLAPPRQLAEQSEPIRLIVEPARTDDRCELRYYLIGSFGGYGSFAAGNYEIPTVHQGAAVDRLKAYLQCPSYQVETVSFEALPPPGNREIRRQLKPLGTVPFYGRVRGLTQSQRDALSVDVGFYANWSCGFFELIDCLIAGHKITQAKIGSDGTFHAALPDYANDPTIASHGGGAIHFQILESATMNRLFELRAIDADAPGGHMAIRSAYPTEQLFDAVPAR